MDHMERDIDAETYAPSGKSGRKHMFSTFMDINWSLRATHDLLVAVEPFPLGSPDRNFTTEEARRMVILNAGNLHFPPVRACLTASNTRQIP